MSPDKRRWNEPHRLVLMAIAVGIVLFAAYNMRWDWLPRYSGRLVEGVGTTLWLLFLTSVLGFLLAVPLGLAQVAGPVWLSAPARAFCTVIRGTPLLLQLWLLYYGLGSLFAYWPEIRQSWAWPYLRSAWPYGVLALTMSFAGYEGEVMRGAFAGVPKGELEAGRAFIGRCRRWPARPCCSSRPRRWLPPSPWSMFTPSFRGSARTPISPMSRCCCWR